jgi:Na+-transporting NADH:ubiquinone oxidoreductase subunit C
MANDTIGKTITVAVMLCIVCSVLVSTAAVKLRPRQERNKALFTKTNILKAGGLLEEGKSIDELFENIEVKYVNLETGEFDDSIDSKTYDAREAVSKRDLSVAIPADQDIANIRRKVKTAEVYLVKKEGELETIIVPVYGKGLWSTMYAFLALEKDGNTVKGYSFYDHGETPGLGGEIDNPAWQKKWEGKKLFDQDNKLAINVLKGEVNMSKPQAIHQVDGLAGATLTTVGVRNLMHFWLGENGFGKFLSKIRNQGVDNG